MSGSIERYVRGHDTVAEVGGLALIEFLPVGRFRGEGGQGDKNSQREGQDV